MTTPLHVLLVEDSADDAQLVLLQLEQDGFTVEHTRVETEEAFTAALSSTPDLILSDYSLPQFDGLRALLIVKERDLDIPFILLSGRVGEEIAVETIKQGADDYLMKDRLARLGSAIKQALEKKQARAEKSLAIKALQDSELRLRTIIETSPDGITLTDFNGIIQMANQQSASIHGYEDSRDMVGLHILNLVAPENHNKMIELSITLWNTKKSETNEFKLLRRDGSTLIGELRSSVITNEIGEPQSVVGIVRDVSERKQAEHALKESEARFRLLSGASLEGIQIHDNGVVLDANLALAKQLGYDSPDELIGKQIMEKHLTPESIKKVREKFTENFDDSYEVEGIRKDGTHFPVEVTSYSLKIDGKDIRIASTRDITEQKKAEENIRNAEIKYRTLIEKIPPIIYISDLQQHIGVNYISPRIESLGYTQNEWVADPELWFRLIHPKDQSKVEADIQESIRTNEPFKSEYRLTARDGSVRWFFDEAIDIVDESGKPLFRQGFMLDITDRKNAEEALVSRERYLALLNTMTRSILLSDDFDTTMHTLAFNMKSLIHADDCYILSWDEEKHLPIPVTTTAKLDFNFSETEFTENDETVVRSAIQTGHVVAVDDILNSSQVNSRFANLFPARSVIGIPLIVGNHKMGAVVIAFNTLHHFTPEEIERAGQAGNQIALALREFQQSLEIQKRLKESNALAEIARVLSATERGGTDKVLQLIVDSARELIQQAEESVIHLLDEEEQSLSPQAISGHNKETKVLERPKMRMGEGVAGQVMRTGKTINIGDITSSPLFIVKASKPTFQSLLVAPVQSGGQQIGTISVQSSKAHAFSNRDVELLNAFSVQATIAIENSHLFEATQQRLKEVDALYRTSKGLATSLHTDELIKDVVNLLQENFSYYHAQIYLLDPTTGNLKLKDSSGELGAKLLEQGFYIPKGVGIVGHVAETAASFGSNDVNEVVFFFKNPLLPETQSELAVPIKVNGAVVGVLDVHHKHPHRLAEGDLQLMTAVADQLSVAIEKANLYTSLQTALDQEQTIRSQLLQSERLALVGRLLASVSHELNNPLQAIQNALFLLKDEERLSTQGKQDLNVILSEAERMASLIDRLRSAYRPVRIKDFQPVELNSLIEDVHTLIGPHMRQKEITFEFFPDTDLPYISGIPDQIRQVVLNLFLNAIEVLNPGGCLIVHTFSLSGQTETLFTVKDTGPGIDPDILPVIFDPFITNKHAGTGLGLTITRDIIEQHHGRIEAENAPEGGAIFTTWFPIYEKG